MKKFTLLMLTFSFIFTFGFFGLPDASVPFATEGVVYAGSGDEIFGGRSIDASTQGVSEATTLVNRIRSGANVFSAIVLAISIIMIIIGGLRYILSSGNPQQAEQGKLILMYSGIGIIIALSAFALGRLFASFSF